MLLQALSTLGSKTENWQIARGNLSKFLRGGGGGGKRLRSRGTSGTPSTHNDGVIAICVVFDFSITFCR